MNDSGDANFFCRLCGKSDCQLLFHLVSRLYEQTSITVTTNLTFAEWRGSLNAILDCSNSGSQVSGS